MSMLIVEKDDASTAGRVAVPSSEKEFVELDLPGTVWMKPVNDKIDSNGDPLEVLETEEWSLGFVAVADPAGGAHTITINALLKISGLGMTPDEIEVRSVTDTAEWVEIPLWWGSVALDPITFKSEIKIDVTGTGTVRLVSRHIPRPQLRSF